MLSAVLPGVREFRTPLVTGLLWVACLWVIVGSQIATSKATDEFVHRFRLDDLPPAMWLGGGALLAYLIGSLLVVRTSPLAMFGTIIKPRLRQIIERLNENREPKRLHHKVVWRLWSRPRLERATSALAVWAADAVRAEAVDNWLHNEFENLAADGRMPVMRSFRGGCNAPRGFGGFCSPQSIADAEGEEEWDMRSELAQQFVHQVKSERAEVEVRVQMRFPEVYAEIDRLKVEGELRLSIFWPMVILSLLLGWVWSPFALLLLLVPPFLLRDGFKRMHQASEKTWGALMAREVKSPVLDAMENASGQEVREIGNWRGSPSATPELKSVEDVG